MRKQWILLSVLSFLIMCGAGCGKKETVDEYFAQSDSLRVKGKLTEAVKKLGEVAEKFPTDTLNVIKSLTGMADIYGADLRDFTKAIEIHQKIIDAYPDYPLTAKSFIIIAVTYENEIKDIEKARQAYEQFLEKYPSHELVPGVKGALDLLGVSDEDLEKMILEKNKSIPLK